jgi:YgiT-type zinc finger domain-containing protein
MENNATDIIPCPDCQAGQLHRNTCTYYTWIGSELITVPDFPSWVCDVCGRREYDAGALNQLSMLLVPNAGKPSKKRKIITKPAVKVRRATRP